MCARRGEHAAAELLARQAVEIGAQTDMINSRGDAYCDLAEVLSLAGRPHEAADALRLAVQLYERKGNVVAAERARRQISAIGEGSEGG